MAAPGPGQATGAMPGAPPTDVDWRVPQFRAKVVAQINDALRDACNPIEKSGNELENHIFNRAKDRDSYLSLVARLILHMRDSNAVKERGLPGRMTPNMGSQSQDPMVALQGLTQMGQNQSPNMQMQPNQNQMVPGVGNQGNRPMLRNQMGQPQAQGGNMMERQQQMTQNLQKLMGAANQQGAMQGGSMPQGVPQAPVQARGMQPGNFQTQAGGNMSSPAQPGMPGTPQGAGQMHLQGPGPGGQMGMQQAQGMMAQQMNQQMTRPQQNFPNQMVMQPQNPQTQMPPRPQVQRTFSGQPTPPVQSRPPMSPYGGYPYMMSPQSVVTDSPAYRQQPSPAQPNQPGSTPGTNPLHSPASYFQPSPSPQSHSIPSPASAGSQRGGGPPSVPSPSSTINTPGNPSSVGSMNPSPGGGVRGGPGSNQNPAEMVAYTEKLRQLSRYIEPLKKAIQANTGREGANHAEQQKLKGLLELLTNPQKKKLALAQLNKCEQLLESMEQLKPVPASSQSTSATATTPTTTTSAVPSYNVDPKVMKPGSLFQPLLDVVRANISSPSFNHSLQRTFGPALSALQGTPTNFPSPPAKKLKTDHDSSPSSQGTVPNIIQGEVARLPPKFRVNLDPMFHNSGREVHLVCRLDDKHLPSVPPISIAIPEQYPDLSPTCDTALQEYGQTQFLKLVQISLQNQLIRMPDRYTLTQVLDAWEMSIRRSCLTMKAARDTP